MDRYPGYESMLARVEQKKVQVNECCNVATVATNTTEDHLLSCSNGPVAPADDTRLDVSEHVNTVIPQVDHHSQAASGSISNELSVSPQSLPLVTQSTIPANIEVKVEDESNGQSVQLCEWIKKEEDDDDYERQLFHCCDCGGEGCEECKVKLEIKEEFDESGETELGGNSGETVRGCTRVKQEEDEAEVERPNKIRRMDRVVGNVATDETVSPPPPPPPPTVLTTHHTVHTNIKVEVDGASNGQLVQHFKCVKKEEEEDGGEYVMECDCNLLCKDCEICRVKMEIKEERDESGETELGGNNAQTVRGCTRVKKEEDEVEIEIPKKIHRMDRVLGNGPVGSPSTNDIPINVEYVADQVSTSSINPITIEDHAQPSQPVTIPTPIFTPTQPSSSAQLVNDEPRMDNVVEVRAEEFDRKQIDEGNSTLNRLYIEHVYQEYDEEENEETIEQVGLSAGDERLVLAENFVKRIEPADELGNRFVCDYRGCGKRKKRKWDLIYHIRTHTGEKRFKCSVAACDRAFFQKCHLDEHFRTHTGERPFKCDQCDATFNRHGNLVGHLRIHSGSRQFVCTWPDCGQAFISSSNLHSHSRVHSNESQFVCDVTGCVKAYKQKGALRQHKKAKHKSII